eukprot:sb/3471400/
MSGNHDWPTPTEVDPSMAKLNEDFDMALPNPLEFNFPSRTVSGINTTTQEEAKPSTNAAINLVNSAHIVSNKTASANFGNHGSTHGNHGNQGSTQGNHGNQGHSLFSAVNGVMRQQRSSVTFAHDPLRKKLSLPTTPEESSGSVDTLDTVRSGSRKNLISFKALVNVASEHLYYKLEMNVEVVR